MWAHIFASRRMKPWRRASEAAAAAPPGAEACGALLYPAAGDFWPEDSRQSRQCAENPCSAAAAESGSACAVHVVNSATLAAAPSASTAEKSSGARGGGGEQPGVAVVKEVRQVWVITMHRQATHLDLTRQMLETLPSSICHLTALRKLTLDDNLLRSVSARSLFPFLDAPLPLARRKCANVCARARKEKWGTESEASCAARSRAFWQTRGYQICASSRATRTA